MDRSAEIGTRIYDYLQAKGIKQKFISEKTGITQYTMSAICRGVRNVSCFDYYQICKALELPYEYFIEEK